MMIKFFRHIRKNQIMENRTSKPALPVERYFKYAIGEIVLVVIGILIALQINNWNENRKEHKMGMQFLKGIQEDLKKDIHLTDSILESNKQAFSILSSIDSVFHKKPYYYAKDYTHFFGQPDTLNFAMVFYRNTSFRSINSTYKSLIADGKSGLIKNTALFQEIQQIYNENHERLASSYEVIKTIETKVGWAYPFEKQHWSYSDLKRTKDKKIFADLFTFTEQKYWYSLNLERIKKNSKHVISLIDKEISND
jgi:hypothetical protein